MNRDEEIFIVRIALFWNIGGKMRIELFDEVSEPPVCVRVAGNNSATAKAQRTQGKYLNKRRKYLAAIPLKRRPYMDKIEELG